MSTIYRLDVLLKVGALSASVVFRSASFDHAMFVLESFDAKRIDSYVVSEVEDRPIRQHRRADDSRADKNRSSTGG